MEWGGGAGEERGSKMDVITTSTLSGFLEEFICSENFYCRFCLFLLLEARRNDGDLFAALSHRVPPEMHTHCGLFRC